MKPLFSENADIIINRTPGGGGGSPEMDHDYGRYEAQGGGTRNAPRLTLGGGRR